MITVNKKVYDIHNEKNSPSIKDLKKVYPLFFEEGEAIILNFKGNKTRTDKIKGSPGRVKYVPKPGVSLPFSFVGGHGDRRVEWGFCDQYSQDNNDTVTPKGIARVLTDGMRITKADTELLFYLHYAHPLVDGNAVDKVFIRSEKSISLKSPKATQEINFKDEQAKVAVQSQILNEVTFEKLKEYAKANGYTNVEGISEPQLRTTVVKRVISLGKEMKSWKVFFKGNQSDVYEFAATVKEAIESGILSRKDRKWYLDIEGVPEELFSYKKPDNDELYSFLANNPDQVQNLYNAMGKNLA